MRWSVVVALVLPVAAAAVRPDVADFQARVVGMADGDTITVLTGDRRQIRIRLERIDAPRTGQDFGARACGERRRHE
jgi:micrococcal nuclease